MEFDREYWEGMTRGALYGHIIKLEAKVEKLEATSKELTADVAILTNNNEALERDDKIIRAHVVTLEAKVEELRASRDWPQLIDTLAAQEATITELIKTLVRMRDEPQATESHYIKLATHALNRAALKQVKSER